MEKRVRSFFTRQQTVDCCRLLRLRTNQVGLAVGGWHAHEFQIENESRKINKFSVCVRLTKIIFDFRYSRRFFFRLIWRSETRRLWNFHLLFVPDKNWNWITNNSAEKKIIKNIPKIYEFRFANWWMVLSTCRQRTHLRAHGLRYENIKLHSTLKCECLKRTIGVRQVRKWTRNMQTPIVDDDDIYTEDEMKRMPSTLHGMNGKTEENYKLILSLFIDQIFVCELKMASAVAVQCRSIFGQNKNYSEKRQLTLINVIKIRLIVQLHSTVIDFVHIIFRRMTRVSQIENAPTLYRT